MTEIYFTERCKKCRRQNFTQDYEGAPLTCKNCGLVGYTESISKDEMSNLVSLLGDTSVNYDIDYVPEEYIELVKESIEQEKQRKRKLPIDKQMESLSMIQKPRKLPSRMKKKN